MESHNIEMILNFVPYDIFLCCKVRFCGLFMCIPVRFSVVYIYFGCKILLCTYFDFQLFLWRMRKGGHLYNITKNSRCINKLKYVCEKFICLWKNLRTFHFLSYWISYIYMHYKPKWIRKLKVSSQEFCIDPVKFGHKFICSNWFF